MSLYLVTQIWQVQIKKVKMIPTIKITCDDQATPKTTIPQSTKKPYLKGRGFVNNMPTQRRRTTPSLDEITRRILQNQQHQSQARRNITTEGKLMINKLGKRVAAVH